MYQLVIPEVECVDDRGKYGRFVIAPLERGFGTTLGNALRRVILGGLPGAAINWVKIEGILHEFTAIPQAKESVEDFLLNVKAVRLRVVTGREASLFLEVEGPGPVCAADIQPSADFEVANPEQLLVTLNSNEARFSVEFNVSIGKGSEIASHSDSLPLGAVPVDALFTPTRKVSYEVELLHQKYAKGQEKLILEIWTDDTIPAAEALSRGAQVLMEQLTPCRTVNKPQSETPETVKGGELLESAPLSAEIGDMPIEQVGLAPSIVQRLRRNGIVSLRDLVAKTGDELLQLNKFGPKSVQGVQQRLRELGLVSTLDSDKVSPGIEIAEEEDEREVSDEDISEDFTNFTIGEGDL